MWHLKTRAFVTLGTLTINKMNILKIDIDISPHVAMGVSNFIHSQKENAFEKGVRWEDAYSQRCDSLPIKWEYNKEISSLKATKNGGC